MKKYLSFVVPCYNSQMYMRKCVDSLLAGGDEVEIIIVNDGSTDDTGKIAREYAERFPGIVRAVQKENGGHGSGVNAGLALASGIYFKVVDSDDWLDQDAYMRLLSELKGYCGEADGDKRDAGTEKRTETEDGIKQTAEQRQKTESKQMAEQRQKTESKQAAEQRRKEIPEQKAKQRRFLT